jgi:hypothetical protein
MAAPVTIAVGIYFYHYVILNIDKHLTAKIILNPPKFSMLCE